MIRPTIQPEELLLTYYWRCARWNYPDVVNLSEHLSAEWRGRMLGPGRLTCRLRWLSEFTGYSEEHLVMKHTMFQVRNIYECVVDGAGRLSDRAPGSFRDAGWCEQGIGRICPDCTSEDLDFHGFSYWRRDHQLDGAWWCLKHGTPLLHVADSTLQCKWHPPSVYLEQGAVSPHKNSSLVAMSGKVADYLQLQSYMLNGSFIIRRDAAQVLERRGLELGFRIYNEYAGTYFGDVVADLLPENWTSVGKRELGGLVTSGMRIPESEHTNRRVFPTTHVLGKEGLLMAAVLLWGSPEEVLTAIATPMASAFIHEGGIASQGVASSVRNAS